MKGSQIWGSENGVCFIARKMGVGNRGWFFIARKSGVVFFMKFREIGEIGEISEIGVRWEIGKKVGMVKFGDGKKVGGENVPEGTKR